MMNMGMSMDQPAPILQNPGMDSGMGTIREHAMAILAIAGRDGVLSPDEQKDIRDLVIGLQQIGQQRVASANQVNDQSAMPSDETSPMWSEGGAEQIGEPAEQPEEGAEYGGVY